MSKNLLVALIFSVFSCFASSSFANGDCGGSGSDVNDGSIKDNKEQEA